MEKSCSSVRYCQFISLGLELHVHVCRSKSKFELDKSSYQLFIVICLQIPHVYCTTLITNNKLTLRIYKISSLSFHLPTSTLQVTDSMLCYPIIVSKMDGLFSNHNSKRQTKLQLDHTLVVPCSFIFKLLAAIGYLIGMKANTVYRCINLKHSLTL